MLKANGDWMEGRVIRRVFGLVACLTQVIALTAAVPADAQGTAIQPPQRPFQGIFNATRPQPNSRESLSLTVSASESHDSDIVGSAESTAGGVPPESGFYSRASSQLAYSKLFRRAQFSADGGATFDFYPQLGAEISQPIDSYSGNAALALPVGRATIQASQAISYQPFFGFDPIGSGVSSSVAAENIAGGQTNTALFDEPTVAYATSAGVGLSLDRRSNVTLTYSRSGSAKSDFWPSINSQTVSALLGRFVTRNLQINGQYSYQFATYENLFITRTQITSHQLSAGFGYSRPLSRTRTLSLNFNLGGSTFRGEPFSGAEVNQNVSARGGLGFQFARSWSVHADYSRSLQVLQGLRQPYYGDTLSFGMGGQPNKRLQFGLDGSWLKGDPASRKTDARFDSGKIVANMQYAFSRNLALFGTYVNSQYSFRSGVELPTGVRPRLDRNVFSIGLTFGTMLLGR